MLDEATEPRDIEKDKATLERAKGYGELTGFAFPALDYYITKYEAQQARIAELEKRQISRMVRYETTYDHEGTKDADAFCPECDREQEVDYCYCPDCGQHLHWEPQSEEEANGGSYD